MSTLKNRSFWVITIFATFGVVYDLVAIRELNGAGLSFWGVAISVLCAVALCACAGSALDRFYSVYASIRRSRKPPFDSVGRKVAADKSAVPAKERNILRSLMSVLQPDQSFELLICKGAQSGDQSISVRHRRMGKNELNEYLKCLLEHSVLE